MKTATGTPPRLHSTETDCMRPKSEVKDKAKQTNKLALMKAELLRVVQERKFPNGFVRKYIR